MCVCLKKFENLLNQEGKKNSLKQKIFILNNFLYYENRVECMYSTKRIHTSPRYSEGKGRG